LATTWLDRCKDAGITNDSPQAKLPHFIYAPSDFEEPEQGVPDDNKIAEERQDRHQPD